MSTTLDDLAAKVIKKSPSTSDESVKDSSSPESVKDSSSPRTDRGIKRTLLDDYAIEIAMKIATLAAILVLGSIAYLWLEKATSAPAIVCDPKVVLNPPCVPKPPEIRITPFRVWFPVVGWIVLAFVHKPFLRLGWWGLLATLSILPTVSGYLWQLFQGLVGQR